MQLNISALPGQKEKLDEAREAAAATRVAAHEPEKLDAHEDMQRLSMPCMLIIINYFTVLIETESGGKLQQALLLKQRLYEMYHKLARKEQDKLAQGVVSQVNDIPVFPYAKVSETLDKIVAEMEQYLELAAKRAALEAEEELRRRLEEEDSLREDSIKADSISTMNTKQKRKERKERYAQQRKLDAAKRVEVTKQRKALYEMIQTNRITTIFNERARGGAAVDAPGWGEQNEQEMTTLNNEMDTLTSTLVSSAIEGDEKHDAALARKREAENEKTKRNS